jgi:hypothetical protein
MHRVVLDTAVTSADASTWDESHDHEKHGATTTQAKAGNTVVLWRVVPGATQTVNGDGSPPRNLVHAKLLHRGNVGWIAMGLESIGGHHNGMNGAEIVMALNWGEPDGSPKSTSQSAAPEPRVGEFIIHPRGSAFRHWVGTEIAPGANDSNLDPALTSFSVEERGVTTLEFGLKGGMLHGKQMNLSSSKDDSSCENRMIWGLTHSGYSTDAYGYYAPYHEAADRNRALRPQFRGRVTLNLCTGEAKATPVDSDRDGGAQHGDNAGDDHSQDEEYTAASGTSDKKATAITAAVSAVVAAFVTSWEASS